VVNHLLRSVAAAATAGIVLLAMTGCGRNKRLTDLSGKVSWRNAPVPAGVITIEPDSARDNRGPQCAAGIANGTFKSRSDYGSVSGPVIVRVEGYTGKPEGESMLGRPLFTTYEFTAEIPKAAQHTLDIVVPDEQSRGK
jgi:hypothetical protein